MEIIRLAVINSAERSASDVIEGMLEDKSDVEAFDMLIAMVNIGVEVDEQITEIVTSAWTIIEDRALWKTKYADVDVLQRVMSFQKSIGPLIRRQNQNKLRKLKEMKTITSSWKVPLQDAFPPQITPKNWSRNLLIQIAHLSKRVSQEEGCDLIQRAINVRLAGGHRNDKIVTLKDAQDVLSGLLNDGPEIPPIDDGTKGNRHVALAERSSKTQGTHEVISSIREDQETSQCHTARQDVNEEEADDEFDGEEATGRERSPNCKGKQKVRIASDAANLPACGCAPVCVPFLHRVPIANEKLEYEAAMRLLARTKEVNWMNFCKRHLRLLAGGCAGLYNNLDSKKSELTKRMRYVLAYRDKPLKLRMAKPEWFRKSERPLSVVDRLGPYMWQPSPVPEFHFDAKQVFNRFAHSPTAWDEFQRDGTINIDNFFDHLISPETFSLIDEEFDMYKYHLRDQVDGQAHRGWMRHMFYSLIQQVVRQDPAYWAIMAAARPDKNYRLISYPYYTKDTSKGDSTGFTHLDINVGRLVKSGRGINVIQSSLSLDDEDEDGCTMLVPGFHRWIAEWWARVVERRENRDGYTTNAKNIYTAQDQQDFGRLVPVPCKRGTIRISRPEILHGSTAVANKRRRIVFVGHYGIQTDHETLDLDEAERWTELVKCHQAFVTPRKSTSGEGFRYGRPTFTFRGVTKLNHTSNVGDAMVGARRWDDPRVMKERDILLGADDEAALRMVAVIRSRLVSEFIDAFPSVKKAEMEAYGNRSFYMNRSGQRPPPEQDEVSELSERVSGVSVDEELDGFSESDGSEEDAVSEETLEVEDDSEIEDGDDEMFDENFEDDIYQRGYIY